MKVKIEIKHYLTGAILFEFEKENNTIKDTLLEAIKSSANLRFANLSFADLSFANLSSANLSSANLSSANLSFANLSSANLSSANLSSADLSFANLSSANLSSANLRFANLSSANLSSANLSFANLSSANLRFANLSSADLSFANLRFANLSSANLRFAKNIDSDRTDYWWHIHHETLYEWLTEPVRARINFIKKNKPKNEIDLRLKLLKPVLGKIPTTEKGWERLHKKECKLCPWNGETIFPDK